MSEENLDNFFSLLSSYDVNSIKDVMEIALFLMEKAERIKKLNGAQRKKLVLDVLTKKISEQEIQNKTLETYVLESLPFVIDSLVFVAKSSYNFGKKKGFCCFSN